MYPESNAGLQVLKRLSQMFCIPNFTPNIATWALYSSGHTFNVHFSNAGLDIILSKAADFVVKQITWHNYGSTWPGALCFISKHQQ